MRDIKFRAWNGKRIIPYEDMLLYDNGHNGPVSFVMNLRGGPYNYKYMQYIGLKDKNGKEIFEGDVLEYWQMDGGGNLYPIPKKRRVVKWRVSTSHVGFNVGAGREHNRGDNLKYLAVIGNIYENPDLMEDIK